MSVTDEFIIANRQFVRRRTSRQLPLPPSRKVAIVTCMDARIDPAGALGLGEGEAHVIRNAGGRASEALRSLVISQRLLGTREILVIHHTDCGMLTFSNDQLHSQVKRELGADSDAIDFLPFSDLDGSVAEDVRLLAASPLLEPGTPVRGFVYDVASGALREVSVAQEVAATR